MNAIEERAETLALGIVGLCTNSSRRKLAVKALREERRIALDELNNTLRQQLAEAQKSKSYDQAYIDNQAKIIETLKKANLDLQLWFDNLKADYDGMKALAQELIIYVDMCGKSMINGALKKAKKAGLEPEE